MHAYIYSIYRYYRRYSGIISNRRCFLGVRPNAFQIEDIAECKSSSNDQKSKNKPLNIGMIFGISSIWKSFVPLPFFVFFLQGNYVKSIEHWRPDLGDPPKRRVPKYLLKWDPAGGTLALSPSGGSVKNCSKTMVFFSFFDWGMVIQTTFQIEDNL